MAPAGIGSQVEGTRAVAAALEAGRVTRLLVEKSRRHTDGLIAAARRAGAIVEMVDSVAEEAKTDSPQGLVAQARPIPLVLLEDLFTPQAALLVLDHLEDPRNVGAIARSALAAGMTGLVSPARRASPISATAFKTAAGAFERLPVAQISSVADCALEMSRAGIWTIGLDPEADTVLFGLELLTEPVGIFVGAEGKGLGRLVAQRMDMLVSIPADPAFRSLNASTAATLACFEVRRARAVKGLSG